MAGTTIQTTRPAAEWDVSAGDRVTRPVDYFEYPVLVVDDERENLLAFELNFRDQFEIVTADSAAQALELLASRDFAVIISDQRMPGMSGVELLERTVDQYPMLVRMILTGYTDHESLIDAINLGRIYRYVTKPWEPDTLGITLRRAIDAAALMRENHRLVQTLRHQNEELERIVAERTLELREANARLQRLAVTDGLTGLFNHRHFQDRWEAEVRRARRYGEPVSLLIVDLDEFKNYNDRLGHSQGDVLLRDVASLLDQSSRDVDFVARYGGEEFAIILPVTPKAAARVLAERIHRNLREAPFPLGEVQPGGRVTASIGLATFPEDGRTPDMVFEHADQALYAAKKSGRDRVVAFGAGVPGYEEWLAADPGAQAGAEPDGDGADTADAARAGEIPDGSVEIIDEPFSDAT